MQQLYQRYPEDGEAGAFYALALQATANPNDKTYANQLASAAILERLFAEHPDHPGVAHYLIHAYDYPELAPRALTAARRYGRIAPAMPHAAHALPYLHCSGVVARIVNRIWPPRPLRKSWLGTGKSSIDGLSGLRLLAGRATAARQRNFGRVQSCNCHRQNTRSQRTTRWLPRLHASQSNNDAGRMQHR
jgi:hypothetical protein